MARDELRAISPGEVERKESTLEDFRNQRLSQLVRPEVIRNKETTTDPFSGEYADISIDGQPFKLRIDKTVSLSYDDSKKPVVAYEKFIFQLRGQGPGSTEFVPLFVAQLTIEADNKVKSSIDPTSQEQERIVAKKRISPRGSGRLLARKTWELIQDISSARGENYTHVVQREPDKSVFESYGSGSTPEEMWMKVFGGDLERLEYTTKDDGETWSKIYKPMKKEEA